MTKFLAIVECDRITIKRLKRGARQMVTTNGRLYRTDDAIMIKDTRSGDAMVIYGIDDTQPMHPDAPLVDPDMTRVLIDSAKLSGTKKRIWGNLDDITDSLIKVFVAMIIGGALVMTFVQ